MTWRSATRFASSSFCRRSWCSLSVRYGFTPTHPRREWTERQPFREYERAGSAPSSPLAAVYLAQQLGFVGVLAHLRLQILAANGAFLQHVAQAAQLRLQLAFALHGSRQLDGVLRPVGSRPTCVRQTVRRRRHGEDSTVCKWVRALSLNVSRSLAFSISASRAFRVRVSRSISAVLTWSCSAKPAALPSACFRRSSNRLPRELRPVRTRGVDRKAILRPTR